MQHPEPGVTLLDSRSAGALHDTKTGIWVGVYGMQTSSIGETTMGGQQNAMIAQARPPTRAALGHRPAALPPLAAAQQGQQAQAVARSRPSTTPALLCRLPSWAFRERTLL